MSDSLTNIDVMQGFAIVASNGNVLVSRVSPSPSQLLNMPLYYFTCKLCKETRTWYIPDKTDDTKSQLDMLHTFCALHTHEEKKEYTPAVVKFESSYSEPMDVLADIKVTPPGFNNKMITSVNANALKWAARLSNFNVDLQAANGFVPKYRAACGFCKLHMDIPRDTLLAVANGNGDNYPELAEFLMAHRHDGTVKETISGRKFRNVN